MSKTINNQVAKIFARVRQEKPLIHHITNFVVMNDTANVTLHVGALPVMAHALEEVGEMTSKATSLVLNPGTLTKQWVKSMVLAGKKANEMGIPIVLDPVGAGATKFRTRTNLKLLEQLHIAVVRGNSGEIGALSGTGGTVKGVESVESINNPQSVTQSLSQKWRSVIAITGKRDIVSDGKQTLIVENGHEWLTTITGTGCMATTMVAAFASCETDYLLAAAGGLACFGLAAQVAARKACGPASFKVALFDSLYNLTSEQIIRGVRITRYQQSSKKK